MSESADLHRRIAASLVRLQVVTDAAVRRAADEAHLSPLQMAILQLLVRRPAARVGEIAKSLEVTPGTASAAIATLEAKGHCKKTRDTEEHRAVRVTPTARGRRVAAGLEEWADESLLPLVKELGPEDAGAVLAALLTVLSAAERKGLIEGTRMCGNCRFFRPWSGGDPERPHYCELLASSIRAADLQVDCGDFEVAEPEVREARASLLRSGDTPH